VICSSGIGFDPVLDGDRLTFGFEGIYQGTAVLYDRETGSLWMHLTGRSFEGPLAGRGLRRLASGRHTRWDEWRSTHPGTDVMAPDPRHRRDYFPRSAARSGMDYFPPDFTPTIATRSAALGLSDLVYGVVVAGRARAYPFRRLAAGPGVVAETFEGVAVTVWYAPAARSAAAFDARLEGRVRAFRPDPTLPARFRDEETGSTWNLEGEAVEGPLAGSRLVPLDGLMAEWYGWYANYPSTTLWE
jgi:hypothetical protein